MSLSEPSVSNVHVDAPLKGTSLAFINYKEPKKAKGKKKSKDAKG